jgi:hypothetical protein
MLAMRLACPGYWGARWAHLDRDREHEFAEDFLLEVAETDFNPRLAQLLLHRVDLCLQGEHLVLGG